MFPHGLPMSSVSVRNIQSTHVASSGPTGGNIKSIILPLCTLLIVGGCTATKRGATAGGLGGAAVALRQLAMLRVRPLAVQ